MTVAMHVPCSDGPWRGDSHPPGGSRASSRQPRLQLAACQPEIGQGKQRVQLRCVLGQSSIANFDMPPL